MEKEKNNKQEIILGTVIFVMLIVIAVMFWYIANENSFVIKGDNKVAVANENKTVTQTETKTSEVKNTAKTTSFVQFNEANIQNGKDKGYFLISKSLCGVHVTLKDGNVYVNVSSKEYLSEIENINISLNEEYKVEGLSKKAVDTYVFCQGNGSTIPKVLILLEDGTVEYISMTKGCETKKFISQGKLGDYKDVVRFEEVGVGPKAEGEIGGYHTAVVIQADGKIFEVPSIEG